MLKVIENCGIERDAIEKALIKELFSPKSCNYELVDELAEKLEPKMPKLVLINTANSK